MRLDVSNAMVELGQLKTGAKAAGNEPSPPDRHLDWSKERLMPIVYESPFHCVPFATTCRALLPSEVAVR